MPTYRYRCNECGEESTLEMSFAAYDATRHLLYGHFPDSHLGHQPCPVVFKPTNSPFHKDRACGQYKQVLSFAFQRSMPEHFNHSLGARIPNTRTAKSVLSRASDEATARTGVPHSYEFVDPREPASIGVGEKGLEATERRAVEDGRVEAKKYL